MDAELYLALQHIKDAQLCCESLLNRDSYIELACTAEVKAIESFKISLADLESICSKAYEQAQEIASWT